METEGESHNGTIGKDDDTFRVFIYNISTQNISILYAYARPTCEKVSRSKDKNPKAHLYAVHCGPRGALGRVHHVAGGGGDVVHSAAGGAGDGVHRVASHGGDAGVRV